MTYEELREKTERYPIAVANLRRIEALTATKLATAVACFTLGGIPIDIRGDVLLRAVEQAKRELRDEVSQLESALGITTEADHAQTQTR